MDDIISWYKDLNNNIKMLIKFISFVIVIIIAVILCFNFLYAPMRISGESMSPALSGGDIVFIDKISYQFSEPERFDLVAFKYRYDHSQKYIKRVIGLPGETLYIVDNKIYILDEETGQYNQLEEYYGKYIGAKRFSDMDPVTLGEDEYFVMGDNRYDSDDSRSTGVGMVKKDTIIGRACFRLLPIKGIGSLKYQ